MLKASLGQIASEIVQIQRGPENCFFEFCLAKPDSCGSFKGIFSLRNAWGVFTSCTPIPLEASRASFLSEVSFDFLRNIHAFADWKGLRPLGWTVAVYFMARVGLRATLCETAGARTVVRLCNTHFKSVSENFQTHPATVRVRQKVSDIRLEARPARIRGDSARLLGDIHAKHPPRPVKSEASCEGMAPRRGRTTGTTPQSPSATSPQQSRPPTMTTSPRKGAGRDCRSRRGGLVAERIVVKARPTYWKIKIDETK